MKHDGYVHINWREHIAGEDETFEQAFITGQRNIFENPADTIPVCLVAPELLEYLASMESFLVSLIDVSQEITWNQAHNQAIELLKRYDEIKKIKV